MLLDEFITSVTRANEEAERLAQVCEVVGCYTHWRLWAVADEEAERVVQICGELRARIWDLGCKGGTELARVA